MLAGAMIGSGVIAESQSPDCVILREHIIHQVVRVKHSAATLKRWSEWRRAHPVAAAKLDARQRRAKMSTTEMLDKYRLACSWPQQPPPTFEQTIPSIEMEPALPAESILPDVPKPDYNQPEVDYYNDEVYYPPPSGVPELFMAGYGYGPLPQPVVAYPTPEPSSLCMAITGLILAGSARIIWKHSAETVDNSGV